MLIIDYAIVQQHTSSLEGIRQRIFQNRSEEVCLRFHLLPSCYEKRDPEWVCRKLCAYRQACRAEKKRLFRKSRNRNAMPVSDAAELWLEGKLARRIGWRQPELTEELLLWTVRRFDRRPAALICLDEPAQEERLLFRREKLDQTVWLLHGRLNRLLIVTEQPELYSGLFRRVYEDSGLVGSCAPVFHGLPAGWNKKDTMVLDLTGEADWDGCCLEPRKFLDTMMKSRYNTLIVSRPGE